MEKEMKKDKPIVVSLAPSLEEWQDRLFKKINDLEQENKELRDLLTRLLNDSMCSVVGEELIEQALKR
jgi:hypothetical protein